MTANEIVELTRTLVWLHEWQAEDSNRSVEIYFRDNQEVAIWLYRSNESAVHDWVGPVADVWQCIEEAVSVPESSPNSD